MPTHYVDSILNQDAKRPFQGGGGLVSEAEYGLGGGWPQEDYRYDAAREADDVGFDKGTIEERSIIDELKKSGEVRQQGFLDRLKFWQTSAPPTGHEQPPDGSMANVREGLLKQQDWEF